MSKADNMFEELGYEKIRDNKSETLYKKDKVTRSNFIDFDYETKTVMCDYSDEDYEINGSLNFNMQELKAINEKVKELGWNE